MTITVNGRSMAPLLQPDDQIMIEAVEHTQLAIGDIVTVFDQNSLLTHRFWGSSIGSDDIVYLHTCRERPFQQDPPLPAQNLVGRVVQRKRHNQILNLQVGIGKWINKHLILLLKIERRIGKQGTVQSKIIQRVIKEWSVLITGMVNIFHL